MPKEPAKNLTQILMTLVCVAGSLGILFFVISLEGKGSWASQILQALLQHFWLSIGVLLLICFLVCVIPFRKGRGV